jgi:hypothetical protein
MIGRLEFDDRLLNPYAVDDLAAIRPALHRALQAWFSAFGDFDDTSLTKLLAARTPAEVERWRTKAEASLASIPSIVATLDAAIREIEAAQTDRSARIDPSRLHDLRQSAETNRVTLVEQAPALVAAALGAATGSDDGGAEAALVIERAVSRFEALRVRSEADSAPFRELQPLVALLQDTWNDVNRELATLSRPDQQAVRASGQARMRSAARAICDNVYRRKQHDRAAGRWPMPAIPSPGDPVPERFAAALARGELTAAHALLAPWLATAWTAEGLAAKVRESAEAAAAGLELGAPPPVAAWYVGQNPLTYGSVRASASLAAEVPGEVTADNYRAWYIIEWLTDDEDGYLTDLDSLARAYVAVVGTPDGDRIGHLAFEG